MGVGGRKRWMDEYGGWRQWLFQALIVLIVLVLMGAYWYTTEREDHERGAHQGGEAGQGAGTHVAAGTEASAVAGGAGAPGRESVCRCGARVPLGDRRGEGRLSRPGRYGVGSLPTFPNSPGRSRVPADPIEVLRKRLYWDRFYGAPNPQENLPFTKLEQAGIRRHVLGAGMKTAVDVGSGWGVLTTALAREGLHSTGYDWSPVAVERARNSWLAEKRLSFEVHDFLTDNAPQALVPGSVDVLACRLVLPYLDLHRFMTDARRWVKPRTGVVYVVVQVWERQPEGSVRGYPNALIEQLRAGWLHTERWDLDWSSEVTALALTGPTGY